MGEGTSHVAGASARVRALGAEATAARERLDMLVAELRHRRDELMDWRTQLRKHRRELQKRSRDPEGIVSTTRRTRCRVENSRSGCTTSRSGSSMR